MIHERPKGFRQIGNNILQGHRLSQEFIVMAFVREQQQKLRWIKDHQKQIRAESYQTLKKNIKSNTETGDQHGKRIILPATYYGSSRWYGKKDLEALAIVRKHGKPNLFITMTCNPNHPQILAALPHGATPGSRPDIVLRIFNQQVHQLVHALLEKKIPGWEGVKGLIKVIEFQKEVYHMSIYW